MSSCDKTCSKFDLNAKLMASLYAALSTFICFLLIGCPGTYWLTSFLGTTVKSLPLAAKAMLPGGVASSWLGWILHSIVAGLLGYGLSLLFMAPWKKDDKCCCPVNADDE